MLAHYTVKYVENCTHKKAKGIVIADKEEQFVTKLLNHYGREAVEKFTIWFKDDFDLEVYEVSQRELQ